MSVKPRARRHSVQVLAPIDPLLLTPGAAPLATPETLSGKKEKKPKKRKLSFQGFKNLHANLTSLFDSKVLQRHMSIDDFQSTQNEVEKRLNRTGNEGIVKANLKRHASNAEIFSSPFRANDSKLDTLTEKRETISVLEADGNLSNDDEPSESVFTPSTSPSNASHFPSHMPSQGYICHSGSCYTINSDNPASKPRRSSATTPPTIADIGKPPVLPGPRRTRKTRSRTLSGDDAVSSCIQGHSHASSDPSNTGAFKNSNSHLDRLLKHAPPTLAIIPSTPKAAHNDLDYEAALYSSQSCMDVTNSGNRILEMYGYGTPGSGRRENRLGVRRKISEPAPPRHLFNHGRELRIRSRPMSMIESGTHANILDSEVSIS